MTQEVDILLKVTGDSRGAVGALRDVGTAAEQQQTKVAGLSSRLLGLASAGVGALGDLASGTGVGLIGLSFAGRIYDRLFNTAANASRAEANLQYSTSGPDLARNFFSEAIKRAESFSGSGGFLGLGKHVGTDLYRWLTQSSHPGVDAGTEQAALQAFTDLARSDPNRAAALLTQNLGKLEYLRPRLQAELDATAQGRRYTESLQPTQINVYTGVGDRNSIGREVRAALDARDRNNGRYTTTITRRGG